MPDRSNPTVVVTDGGGGVTHAGEGKRAGDHPGAIPETVGTKVVIPPTPNEPPFMATWPTWAKMSWSYGPFIIILIIYMVNERERAAERREDRAEIREARLEERELRKLEVSQRDRESAARDRRDEGVISELRAITTRIDADRVKADAESKVRKQAIEETTKAIEKLVSDMAVVIDSLKRLKVVPAKKPEAIGPADPDRPLFAFQLPISVPERMPELAPAPRLVRGRLTVDEDGGGAGAVRNPAVTHDGGR